MEEGGLLDKYFGDILRYDERSCQNQHPKWNLSEDIPTVEQFYRGLGGWAIALYTCSALTMVIMTCQYLYLIHYFMEHVPATRRAATLWVNSVYLIASIMALYSNRSKSFLYNCHKRSGLHFSCMSVVSGPLVLLYSCLAEYLKRQASLIYFILQTHLPNLNKYSAFGNSWC